MEINSSLNDCKLDLCLNGPHTDEERHKLLGLFPSYILTLFRGIFAINLFLVFFFFLKAKLGKDFRKILWILFLKNTLQISQTVTSNIRNETKTLNKYVRNKMLTNAMRKLYVTKPRLTASIE